MKKAEIEAIIKDHPTAVFALEGNYKQFMVITGFKHEKRYMTSTQATTYAVGFRVNFYESTDGIVTAHVTEWTVNATLPRIAYVHSNDMAEFVSKMQTAADRVRATRNSREQQKQETIDAVLKLKELGFDAAAHRDQYAIKYTVMMSTETLNAIIELINTHAASI